MPLALEIARLVKTLRKRPGDPVRFLEPALGTGAFFSALRQTFPRDLINIAAGIERDPRFAGSAERLWSQTGLAVRQADFTMLEPPADCDRFNVVLTNPPYVRHHHLDRGEKQRLKRAVLDCCGIEVSGLAGLYSYFMLLAHEWMREGAIAAWLIPSEFMDVNYGAALRSYLTQKVRLLRIHRFNAADTQFDDALVTSTVVIFEKEPATQSHVVSFTTGGSLADPLTARSVLVSELTHIPKWIAVTSRANSGAKRIGYSPTIGSFFTVKRGIATGANAFFILDRTEACSRGIPETFLRPILPGSRHLRHNIIECGPDGYPAIDRPIAVIDCPFPEAVIEERYPRFWSYLLTGKVEQIHNGYLPSRRSPWYSQESRAPAPFLCTYMGREGQSGRPFRFFWNQSRAIAPNVFLMMYPHRELLRTIEARPDLLSAIFEALNRITPKDLIEAGRAYGGGLHKLEPRELLALPALELDSVIRG